MPLQHPVETFTPDNLFSAVQLMPIVPGTITIASGQGKLARGALVTASGALCGKTADSGATADEVYAVLADDVDATSAAVVAACYFTGEFNAGALSFKTDNSATIDDFVQSARKVGIFIREKNI